MSWSFDYVGSKTAVKAAIAESYAPDSLKQFINESVDALNNGSYGGNVTAGVRVTSHGHHGSGIGKLEISTVAIVNEPSIPAQGGSPGA